VKCWKLLAKAEAHNLNFAVASSSVDSALRSTRYRELTELEGYKAWLSFQEALAEASQRAAAREAEEKRQLEAAREAEEKRELEAAREAEEKRQLEAARERERAEREAEKRRQLLEAREREIAKGKAERQRRREAESAVPDARAAKVYAGVGGGHWIKQNIDGGSFIVLEDRSLWQIDRFDKIYARLWLAITSITVTESNRGSLGYDYLLINTDDGETAHAKYIGKE